MKLIEFIQDNWGWFVTIAGLISGWVAHTNWDRVLAVLSFFYARGGLLYWLWTTFVYNPGNSSRLISDNSMWTSTTKTVQTTSGGIQMTPEDLKSRPSPVAPVVPPGADTSITQTK